MKTVLTTIFAIGLLAAQFTASAESATNPFLGTWRLNPSKSIFAEGNGGEILSQTRVYSKMKDGMTKVVLTIVEASDKREHTITKITRQDGKIYPVTGSWSHDSVSERQVNPNVATYKLIKSGHVIADGRRTVSKDGKTLTLIETGKDKAGTNFKETVIFDKVSD